MLLAAANAFVKAGSDILMARTALQLCAALIALPLALLFAPLPDARTWGALALAAPAHFIYQMAMIRALHRADLSLVFPIMRGVAPLLTAIVALAVLGEGFSALAFLGLTIAGGAAVAFALPERLAPAQSSQRRAALLWALATAAGIALYNVVDAWGVRGAPTPLTFILWLFVVDCVGVSVVAAAVRRGAFWTGLKAKAGFGAAGAALSIGSYGLALYGFSIAPVAQISALRETAVVFAALLAAVWLREPFGLRRGLLALLMAAGLGLLRLA